MFDEPWLVVDVLVVNDAALGKLPETAAQFCDPARPTYLHRRPRQSSPLGDHAAAGRGSPRDGSSRSRSGGCSAEMDHAGRRDAVARGELPLPCPRRPRSGGGAASSSPATPRISSRPSSARACARAFATSETWSGSSIGFSKGSPATALLDTYGEERGEHVRQLTTRIKAIGKVICERDPDAARDARCTHSCRRRRATSDHHASGDRAAAAERPAGAHKTIRRTAPCSRSPGCKQGTAATCSIPWLGPDGASSSMAGASPDIPQAVRQEADDLGLHVIRIGSSGSVFSGRAVMNMTQSLSWMMCSPMVRRHGCHAAIVRPDHYVFGTASGEASLAELMADLRTRLLPSATLSPHADHSPVSLHARNAP